MAQGSGHLWKCFYCLHTVSVPGPLSNCPQCQRLQPGFKDPMDDHDMTWSRQPSGDGGVSDNKDTIDTSPEVKLGAGNEADDESTGNQVLKCSSCNHENTPKARICANPVCGKSLQKTPSPEGPPCFNCKNPLLKQSSKRCDTCGKQQTQTTHGGQMTGPLSVSDSSDSQRFNQQKPSELAGPDQSQLVQVIGMLVPLLQTLQQEKGITQHFSEPQHLQVAKPTDPKFMQLVRSWKMLNPNSGAEMTHVPGECPADGTDCEHLSSHNHDKVDKIEELSTPIQESQNPNQPNIKTTHVAQNHEAASGSDKGTDSTDLNNHQASKARNNSGGKPSMLSYSQVHSKDKMVEATGSSSASQDFRNFRGLKAKPPDAVIKMTFHVIIPVKFWEWDEGSKMHIQFGLESLGNWRDCGEFVMTSDLGRGWYEMSCTFETFNGGILKSQQPIPYKYVVHSNKTKDDPNSCYEFLHSHATNNEDKNRCLFIADQRKLQYVIQDGKYHKYDTVAYPRRTAISKSFIEKVRQKGVFSAVTSSFVELFKAQDPEENQTNFQPFSAYEDSKFCLQVYLTPYKNIIHSGRFQEKSMVKLVEEVAHIEESLTTYFIIPAHTSSSNRGKKPFYLDGQKFKEEFKSWLESLISSLQEEPLEDARQSLVAAMFILLCTGFIYADYAHLKKLFIESLVRMLVLKPDSDLKSCPEYNFLMSHLSKPSRIFAAQQLQCLLSQLVARFKFNETLVHDYLCVLPLYNLLTNFSSEPFCKMKVVLSITDTHLNALRLTTLKHLIAQNIKEFVPNYYSKLKPYFELDPGLLSIFVYLTPETEFRALCTCVPPSLTSSLLLQNLEAHRKATTNNKIREWAANIKYVRESLFEYDDPEMLMCVKESSVQLFKYFTMIRSSSDDVVSLIGESVSNVLQVITQLDTHSSKDCEWHCSKRGKVLGCTKKAIHDWIVDKNVIGGSVFGSTVPMGKFGDPSSSWKQKGKKELMIWNKLLSVECPQRVVEEWQSIVKYFVVTRIYEVKSPKLKIELVCLIEDMETISPILAEVVMDAGYKGIDILLEHPDLYGGVDVDQLAARQSQRIGMLLGRILKKKYPDVHDRSSISLDDLLEWPLWPNFIKIFVSKTKLKQGIPKEYQFVGDWVRSCLQEICKSLESANATLKEVEKIGESHEQMKRLCQALSSDEYGNALHRSVETALRMRLEECKMFRQNLEHLFHLYHHLDDKVQGLDELQSDLQRDVSEQKICELCVRIQPSNSIQLLCFKSAGTLLQFASEFYVVSGQKVGKNLFLEFWADSMQQVSVSKGILKLDDILHLVWKPTLQRCKDLLESLADLSIKLTDVKTILKSHEENLETNLLFLLKGIKSICSMASVTDDAVNRAAIKVKQYWNLCQYRRGAETFLDVKDCLGLTKGDFSLVEELSQQLSSSVKDQTLHDVNSDLIQTGEFLKDVTANPKRIQCLKRFSKCKDIVEWLREVTKDVNEIQTFVNVALATAAGGEGALAHDMLSTLRTVGSGFASLIYDFPESAGFNELKKACGPIWDALDKNENLPKLLETCNKHIDWYRYVKDAQASVEATSYGQMRNILRYGYYQIGTDSHSKAASCIHDLISLRLIPGDEPVAKTFYNLDDLRDLESKLVLITGGDAENRVEVDHFLNVLHHVTRIAEVLLSLKQTGNTQYTMWMIKFDCVTYNTIVGHQPNHFQEQMASQHVEKLLAVAKSMEVALDEWKKEVKAARSSYYELNYYTVFQLLKLRKELSSVRQNPGNAIHPMILALLESLSPEVTPEIICSIMSALEKPIPDTPSKVKVIVTEELAENHIENHDHVMCTPRESIYTDNGMTTNECTSDENTEHIHVSESPTTEEEAVTANIIHAASLGLTEDDLNVSQRDIYTDLVEFQKYSKFLVLNAFKECPEDANLYDIQDWCDENESNIDYQWEESVEDEELDRPSDIEDSEFSSEDENHENMFTQGIFSTPSPSFVKLEVPSVASAPEVKVIHREIINESHSVVQQLVNEFYYKLSDSIEAVQLYGNLQSAMDYLAAKDIKNKDEEHSKVSTASLIRLVPEDRGKIVVYSDFEVENKYLSLDELGKMLGRLSHQLPGSVRERRTFNEELMPGCPNLIVTSFADVFRTVLTLYMENEDFPLPTLEEVLICDATTTAEEVNLLWQRAIGDFEHKRIFCLVHAEKLSYQICDKVVEALKEFSQAKNDYRLIVVSCSKEGEDKAPIESKLLLYKKTIVLKNSDKCKKYLRNHFISASLSQTGCCTSAASVIDHEKSCVRVVSSRRSGMGKSLFIRRMAEQLDTVVTSLEDAPCLVTIPIFGPVVTADVVLNFLKMHFMDNKCKIYHFDIALNILSKVDTILFSLLVLRGITDTQGCVWRCHTNQLYAIEVTIPEKRSGEQSIINPAARVVDFLGLLPIVECLGPKQTIDTTDNVSSSIGMDDKELKTSTFQRVYQYLKRHNERNFKDLDKFTYRQGSVEGSATEFLNECLTCLMNCGLKDPSWCEIRHFTKFLDLQLESCEQSVFCDASIGGDVLPGMKEFVVKFMIRMSMDFATPSLQGEVSRHLSQHKPSSVSGGNIEDYEIYETRRWEKSSHPYILFNKDRTFTFFGFKVTGHGDLYDSEGKLLEAGIMKRELHAGLKHNGVNLYEDYEGCDRHTMIEKLLTVIGVPFDTEDIHDPDCTYVLKSDNVIKILAIQMRFRCGIPVVIMGETGCGKTRLIRYMCDLAKGKQSGQNMLIMKIHGGTKEEDIVRFIAAAEDKAKENCMDTVVFFDEANTTDAIGLIKEIMCDRRIHGRPVSEELKFIAACNPYRRHSDQMIKRLEKAGLGFSVRASETKQRLGKIPLRELVYRVLDLPSSMRPLVYDFGQLQKKTEDSYIDRIVSDHIMNHPTLSREDSRISSAITKVLATSQQYMRTRKDECSFVSLRDVERAMIVFKYFYEKMSDFHTAEKKQHSVCNHSEHPDNITSALILTVSLCYHSRLQEREDYEKEISSRFEQPLQLPGQALQFKNEIVRYQSILLDNMDLGPNIAKNEALRENVFMMAICVELRIPLFLVGKPGSSKSLAKSIIQDSMHGETSRSDLLKTFKQVHMFSYQCSQLATPESVIGVFNSAKKYQSTQDTTQYVSVVVLDEVGLAEDSPNLPLKALHPLLEDGTEDSGNEGRDMIISREQRVAFIGISNWALDPAKMNRGVMVMRGIPDVEELEFSAQGICSKDDNDHIKSRLDCYFKPLAEAYKTICEKQDREFFGLRDFYSLIKMLYWMCKKSRGAEVTWPQMKHAIMRNFGGLESKKLNPLKEFRKQLILNKTMPEEEPNPDDYEDVETIWSVINPDCSRLGLIKTSLGTKETSFHGENRYLLFLTENYTAALDILEHFIRGKKHGRYELPSTSTNKSIAQLKPFTIFGSSFPKDKEYTQVCRNINQIKICMETGRTVILLNLENLYESLYDVLNQYYMHYGNVRYVDLGLQSHRVKCRVHDDFKLILIAERDSVYDNFATPLINRLEKHFVLSSSVLKEWQQEVLEEFTEWIKDYSNVTDDEGKEYDFKEGHAFIGFKIDTPAAVVFQASKQLKKLKKECQWMPDSLHESSIFCDISFEKLYAEPKGSDIWKKAVLRLSQYLLLQTASDDSLIRLERTALADRQRELMRVYSSEQHHHSIVDFVDHYIHHCDENQEGLLMQVTTHGHILLREELKALENIGVYDNMRVESLLLQEFDTELDFSNRVGPLFHRNDGDKHSCLIVIQCDSGHLNGDLIACARYRIYDERVKGLERNKSSGVTHVLFIINLPHQVLSSTKFVGFQGDPWISAHIDDLRPTTGETVEPLQALNSTISELFIGEYIHDIEPVNSHRSPLSKLENAPLHDAVHLKDPFSEPLLLNVKNEHQEFAIDEPSEKDSESGDFTSEDYNNELDTHKQASPSCDTASTHSLSLVEQFSKSLVPKSKSLESLSEDEKESISQEVCSNSSDEMGVLDTNMEESHQDSLIIENSDVVTSSSILSEICQEELEKQNKHNREDLPIIPFELFSDQLDPPLHTKESDIQFQAAPVPMSLSEENNFQPPAGATNTIVVPPLIDSKSEMKHFAQCKRLYASIQKAASKLEDSVKDRSTQRITCLTKLIPRNSVEHLDLNNFYGILVMHIYCILNERETTRPDLSDWVLTEALSASSIELGGTFRNVLAHKIADVVVPIFASIIACIDRYYNLNLINPKAIDSPLTRFWLSMFRSPQVQQFKYSDMIQGEKVLGIGGRKREHEFECHLPFFWLIKGAIDSQWDNAKSHAGFTKRTHHDQLCQCVRDSPVGVVLDSVDQENSEDFYQLYLHDFVKSVHMCKHNYMEQIDMELSLVSKALDHVIHCSEFRYQSLISMVVALHIAYETNQTSIFWFSQIVTHSPSIMQSLVGKLPKIECSKVELHLYAAERLIEKLEPPLQKDSPNQNLAQWLNHIRLSQNTIHSILNLKSRNERVVKARHGWHRLLATRLFVEHVMLKHPDVDLKILARRLCGRWKGNCDFLKASTVNAVQLQLGGMEKLLKRETKCNNKDKIEEVKNSCRVFFMEVVSELCFRGQAIPETPLVKMLLDTVFKEDDDSEASTQDLTPYKDDQADTIPTIRSFLLQLLLEHSIDQVKEHLKDYLDRSYHVLVEDQIPHTKQSLYLLIIQCFEDAITKRMVAQTKTRLEETTDILIQGHKALQEHQCGTPTLEYLEGVAKVRHSLSVVAELLKSKQAGQAFENLLRAAEQLCSDRELNNFDSTGCRNILGPVVYFLKLLVRRYGMPFLKTTVERYEWIIPAELKSDNDKLWDPFVIYKGLHVSLRKAVNGVMYGNEIEVLVESTKNLKSNEVVNVILAIFEKATLSRATNSSANRISNDALERMDGFIMKYSLLSNELRLMARALLANQQGGRVLEQMFVCPQQPLHCRTLMGVVVHAAAVFFSRKNVDILSPFVNMLNNPAILNQSYLPTMQEDPLVESQGAMLDKDERGKFYECPNGHKYFIGDCGGTYHTGVCNVCMAPIGGASGEPLDGNKLTNTQDATKKGHDLGSPENHTISDPERNLSARAVCIVRALMHSAFVWVSCNNDTAVEAIASLVTPRVPPQHLPEFFWAHLEKDVELLGRDTGRGLDEAVMIVHLILQRILTVNPPTDGDMELVSSLGTKEARKEWERIFNEHYILPVLSTLDERLMQAMDLVAADDDQQDRDQLFYLVYEKVKYDEDSLEPHLWTYRSRITLEHLRQTLQEETIRDKHLILYEFLQNEADLRATQYLPDIARIQRCLYDRFNRQVDREVVNRQTIKSFVMELPNEAIKNEYREMIDSVKAAWSLVGHKLKNHGRLPVEEKYYVAYIYDNTPMEYLVPTTSEAGVCTTALVDFLTLTHNNFIERCRGLVARDDQSTLIFWREHNVPITHLHRCHLLDYEHQLPSIILSHCQYSLKVGKGQDVKYDHHALEKHILNRFIHGKPLILVDIPQVVYRKTIFTMDAFANVRKNVEPQEQLQQRVKQDIIAELRTPDRLRDALDVVETVLGFLSSGGGKAADKPLGEYMDKTLKMNEVYFCQKAKSSCQLKHVLSLWKTIAVELARQLCLRGQEPFESIRQEYLCELSKEDDVDQFTALDRCLGHFDPDLLLGTLYEFIRTYVTHCKPHECDQPLMVVLEAVLYRYGTELPHLKEFPASIKLDQTVATWKHIVHYYDKKN